VTSAPPGLDLDALRWWLPGRVPQLVDASRLRAELIAGGRSNLTYAVMDGEHSWVLRRPPLGHVLPTAHDMRREFRVISALQNTDVPVPQAYALCEDVDVVGAPFYVMERVDGMVVRRADDAASWTAAQARHVSDALVRTLAALHAVDYVMVGLQDFGRPEGFLERQVRRWGTQHSATVNTATSGSEERQRTILHSSWELPLLDELQHRLAAHVPPSPGASIVHGDFRLDNVVVRDQDGRPEVAAVLDWEMATIGDPLTDLGLLVAYWQGPGEIPRVPGLAAIASATTAPGHYTSDEVVSAYAARSSVSLDHLDWYVAFGLFKIAVILEGIDARMLQGKTVGAGFETIGVLVEPTARAGLDLTSRAGLR
jgi:aminoglycoside phosphotransferase (APT) family kinase protein